MRIKATSLFLVFLMNFNFVFASQNEKLTGPVVFHWFRGSDSSLHIPGQVQSPWIPLEGRDAWDGSYGFWLNQEKMIRRAGFNMEIFQVPNISLWEQEMQNHLEAIKSLNNQGMTNIKVAPLFAAESWPDYGDPKPLLSRRDVENFYLGGIKPFFDLYFETLGAEDLARVRTGGRPLVFLWWVPIQESEHNTFSVFDELNNRLERDFGFRAFWSAHVNWRKHKPNEINFLFNGMDPVQYSEYFVYPGKIGPAADILVGFWSPDSSRDFFLPRNGGKTYTDAWNEVLERLDIKRVYVESWNEYSEGSGMFPALPMYHTPNDDHADFFSIEHCWDNPCHPLGKNDWWGESHIYIQISRASTGRFLGINRRRKNPRR